MRSRNNNIKYCLEVNDMTGEKQLFSGIDNLACIADIINGYYFSDFPVISRAMVSNWFYKPDSLKRPAFDRFVITKQIIS